MTRRRLLAATVAAATIAVPAASASAAAASAAPAPAAWAATQTRALPVAGPALGAAPAGMRLTVSVGLALRNRAAMNRLAVALSTPGSPEYARFLTPAQVAARFGPTAAQAAAVAHWLAASGFTAVHAEPNRLLVDASGTVAAAERAFHTRLELFRYAGRTVYANTAPALVPAALGSTVVSVLGLSDLPMTLPHLVAPRALAHPAAPRASGGGGPDLSGFTPRAVQHAYDAASLPPADATTIAVVASGDMTPIIANLRYAERQQHFPAVPVNVIYTGPAGAITHDNPLTGNLEWDLDTQISTMVAQSVRALDVYDIATFDDPDVARAINLFVAQDRALALSASLGECDYLAFLDGAMVTTDQSLEEGALQGQSMFASTGDNGYACPLVASTGVPEGPPGISWPADGEYTTGVGGTTLLADANGDVTQELAWIGGGGGISPWETAAPWTLQANGAGQSWQYLNQGGRSLPDVAAVADPTTGVLIYGGGTTPIEVGGTSVSSPLTMGLWARVQNVHQDRLGLASYDFYRLYNATNPATVVGTLLGPTYLPAALPQPVAGFRDITVGTNGLYLARAGYDYTTGIGSLDAAVLARRL